MVMQVGSNGGQRTPITRDERSDPLLFELRGLNARLDRIDRRMEDVDRRQRAVSELLGEIGPIGRAMLKAASTELVALEAKGYVSFGREVFRVMDRIVTSYSDEDVRQLGANIESILDTVRAATQPEVLEIAQEATSAVGDGAQLEPVGIMGMLKASRDEDVERGMALLIDLLRRIGKAQSRPGGAKREPSSKKADRLARLAARTAPKHRPVRTATTKTEAKPKPAPNPQGDLVEGWPTTEDGALVDPSSWTSAYGEAAAAALGLELTAQHWKVIDFARSQFAEHGASPNLRKISAGTGVATKELYQLFEKAPGRTVSKIAGIPKPVGCI